ncbi:MAG: carbonic anhydrase [Actinobacteria bacterium HGW-Actinobacteria-1]|nr:MAG: carbonic anhydrase [Actinobacteria bacterium HGW-Actinobacteria-1]
MKLRKAWYLGVVAVLGLALATSGCSGTKTESESSAEVETVAKYERPAKVESPDEALTLLKEGNERFVADEITVKDFSDANLQTLSKGQQPFAVILTCSDSRVPAELLFDQGIGDIFVIRVAGNVIDPIALGSVEYAVEHLGSPLVVVMGHQGCGAVKAAVAGGKAPGSIGSIVAMLLPSVKAAKASGAKTDAQIAETAADMNVDRMIGVLETSPIIEEALKAKELKVVGAKYILDTGVVDWAGGE